LQDRYNLAFNSYNSLSQQLEQALITVQEETPVITLLEPVQVPLERSRPKRLLVIAVAAIIGSIAGVFLILGSVIYSKITYQYNLSR
jgi:uncharacterized protein involved in exopolysaccharide biosynthesis